MVYISALAVDLWREYGVVLLLNPSLSLLFLVCVKESFPLQREVEKLLIDSMNLRVTQRESLAIDDAVQYLYLINNQCFSAFTLLLNRI